MFYISDGWRAAFPEAAVGFLLMTEASNPEHHEKLDERKEALEKDLRARFGGQDQAGLKDLPVIQAYQQFYKPFKKTYHVLLQLQSVIYKDKPIPRAAALVESMFMAELQDQLLTAGHDYATIETPVTVEVSQGDERYVAANGEELKLKPGDMFMRDGKGIISSVIYGPDLRTRITPETNQALFTVYAPAGIGEGRVYEHLRHIQENVQLVTPASKVERLVIFTA